jgi:hypothetical protein
MSAQLPLHQPHANPERLAALRALEENWNSYGAKPPDERAIKAIEDGLSIVPMSDGGIQVELHIRDRDVEIVITPHGWLDSVLS